MSSVASRVRALRAVAAASALLALAACTGTPGAPLASDPASPAANEVTSFPSKFLEGNLLGASADITLGVLLPDAYFTSEDPLPVVYFLPGYTADNVAADMPEILADALNATDPMIVVTVTGVNELGGGWYTDSPVTGYWEKAIVEEVVPYIDSTYRTIPSADARGITGHSMGGYGALTLGMAHPDVFGSIFAMSPAIVGEGGIEDRDVFGSEIRARTVITSIESLDGLEGQALLDTMADSAATWEFSYGTAFAPATEPPYFRYPYTYVDGAVVRDDAVWAEWQAGFGEVDTEVADARAALLRMGGVGLDCGSNDEFQWIFDGCEYLDAQLTAQGVPHVYTVHDGTHVSRFAERIADVMLPFFVEQFEDVRD